MAALIGKAILSVLSLAIGLWAQAYLAISSAFLGVAVTLFNWVTSPNFISLSYTNLAGNPFLKVGWELTRSLTNIVFVIVLVVIGIGTALRIKGYQMQQTLVWLIAMALLVNFTPVILGLIVDASNIVMNYFMSNSFQGGNIFANLAAKQLGLIKGLVGGLAFWDPTATPNAMAAMAGSIVLIFFNIIATIIYLLFALLIIVRYVAIWLLVILSPFAFACYILPRTRGVFSQWWKMFIQWSILGIIMGFFLYLADHFIYLASTTKIIGGTMGEAPETPGLSIIFNSIVPYFIPLILLIVGLIASVSGAPRGAEAIMAGGKRAAFATAKTFGKTYAKRAWEGTKGAAKRTRDTISRIPRIPPIRAGQEAWGINRKLGHGVRESLGAATERAGAAIKLETGWRTKEAIKTVPGAVKAAPGKMAATIKGDIMGGVDALRGKKAAKEGISKAFADSIRAGWKAALKPPKRKGLTKEQIEKVKKGEAVEIDEEGGGGWTQADLLNLVNSVMAKRRKKAQSGGPPPTGTP